MAKAAVTLFCLFTGSCGLVDKATSQKIIDRSPAIILCFHDIDGRGRYSVTSSQLDAIVRLLSKDFALTSLIDWHEGRTRPGRPVAVMTFDDGFKSLQTRVFPILQRHKAGATLFVYLARHPDNSPFYKFLRDLPESFEVGSHTFRHLNLEKLWHRKPAKFFREVFLSRQKLQYLLGKKVHSLAWPYGRYHKKMVPLARQAGYALQVSTDYRVAAAGDAAQILPRFTVQQPRPLLQVKDIVRRFERFQVDSKRAQ